MKKSLSLLVIIVIFMFNGTGTALEIPVCGSMYHDMVPGTWTTMPEVATVYIKTSGGEFYVFDFEQSEKSPKTWYIARLGDFSRLGNFVSLAPSDIKEVKWWTWEEMKNFSQANLSENEVVSLIKAVESYLKEKGWY
ncbi:hypothetical protein KKE13_00455 [Patescibacteria group bacterium]|nr:hypothetical protein [Patescibacteria group bacterium]